MSTKQPCKECGENDPMNFYRVKDNLCKVHYNEYQKERREKRKTSSSSEDVVVKIVDRLLDERSTALAELNDSLLQKLEEINKKLDKITIQEEGESSKEKELKFKRK